MTESTAGGIEFSSDDDDANDERKYAQQNGKQHIL
jgi:hypothetical protein